MKPPLLIGFLFIPLLLRPVEASVPDSTNWVQFGADGHLHYATDDLGNRIPDFSNCGYEGGGAPLPDVPEKIRVFPLQYGDAGPLIQKAIDEVSRLPKDQFGFRGAVVLAPGIYRVEGTLFLRTDGVVLRGEGQGDCGTRLLATGRRKRSLIVLGTGGGEKLIDLPSRRKKTSLSGTTSLRITDSYVPVGARSFHLEGASTLSSGERVIVHRPSTAGWIHALGADSIPQNRDGTVVQWSPGSKDLDFVRVITSVQGNQVTVNAPICCALDAKFGGGVVLTGIHDRATRHLAVENLSGDSEFRTKDDEDHGWIFVEMTSARDSWVRNVTAFHFGYSCVTVQKGSSAITVQDCSCVDPVSRITGGRRYSFALDGELTLVLRCRARNGRHDFVMHATAAGPNAFVDCTAEAAHSDTGPHHRWSVGVLYDNVTVHGGDRSSSAGAIDIENRGNKGTGHGWAGANQVLWNCVADTIHVEQPPTAQNWAIGCRAKKLSGNGYWQSKGFPVLPEGLYRTQLEERLGKASATAVFTSSRS